MTTRVPSNSGDPYNVLAVACPTRQVIDRLGDKWTLLVLSALADRPHRFRDLQRTVEGISQRMLTQTLRNLEHDGLVLRTVEPTRSPWVTYSLTELGQSLDIEIARIRSWAYAHIEEIESARRRYGCAVAPAVSHRPAAVEATRSANRSW